MIRKKTFQNQWQKKEERLLRKQRRPHGEERRDNLFFTNLAPLRGAGLFFDRKVGILCSYNGSVYQNL